MRSTRPKPAKGADGRFVSGNSGGGRPTGSRNRLSEQFIQALCGDFEKHGPNVIETVRQNEPGTYLRVIASVLPKRIETETRSLTDLSDAELVEIARGIPSKSSPGIH